jgi:valyl-tRNA synthetase
VLDRLLRLLHPVMPFVTDELWTALTGGQSVMVAAWPSASGLPRDAAAEAEIEALMRLVTQVRRFRSDQGLHPGQRVAARLTGIESTPLAAHEASIRALLRLTAVSEAFVPTASVQAEGVTVELDTAGAVDVGAERRRLEKDLAVAAEEVDRTRRKLANPGFTAKAPAAVIEKTQQRLAAAEAEIEALQARLAALPPA